MYGFSFFFVVEIKSGDLLIRGGCIDFVLIFFVGGYEDGFWFKFGELCIEKCIGFFFICIGFFLIFVILFFFIYVFINLILR